METTGQIWAAGRLVCYLPSYSNVTRHKSSWQYEAVEQQCKCLQQMACRCTTTKLRSYSATQVKPQEVHLYAYKRQLLWHPHLWHCFEFLLCGRWWLFPHHGCYIGSECHVSSKCCISCTKVLQKLLSMNGNVSNPWDDVPYNMLQDHQPGFLTHILHTFFCNPVDHGQCWMHYSAMCLALGQSWSTYCVCPLW